MTPEPGDFNRELRRLAEAYAVVAREVGNCSRCSSCWIRPMLAFVTS